MSFGIQIAPAILLFLVVAVAALPAIAQGRMLLLGTSAFYTAGAFLCAYVGAHEQVPGTLSIAAGGLAGGLAALFLAIVSSRLRGDYFALATLCFAELLRLTLLISPPFPGPQGIAGVTRGTLLSISIESAWAMTTVAAILLVAVIATTTFVTKSPWGASLQAAHDNEVAARTSGLPVGRIRLAALVYTGIWGGLAGALSVRYLSLADAESFSLSESILVLVVVLLAGRPDVFRCLAFGAAVATLSELLRFVTTGAVRQITFGTLLFVMALVVRDDLRQAETSEERP